MTMKKQTPCGARRADVKAGFQSDMLESALAYARLGWHVFPLRPGEKTPLIKGWQHNATHDEAMIRQWWGTWPSANIGLACGLSKLVVIDLDVKGDANGIETWRALKAEHGIDDDTVASSTPSGGMHLLFSANGADVPNSAGRLGPGVDVRGDGGYVVLPPSMLKDGGAYTWNAQSRPGERQLAPLPAQLLRLLTSTPSSEAKTSTFRPANTEAYAQAAFAGELGRLGAASEGERNETLNRVAFRLGQFVGADLLDRGATENKLHEAALSIGLGESETKATIRSGINAGMARPFEIPARSLTPSTAKERSAPYEYPRTDYGNAERMVKQHGKDLRYCFAWKAWLVWDGRRWVIDQTGEVERRAKETVRAIYAEAARQEERAERKAVARHAASSESNARLKAMIEVARSEPGIQVQPDELDADRWLLNCNNGTIDLRTGKLLKHRREDLITKLAPVDYDPDATHPLWERFLEEMNEPEVVSFLRRAVGYTVTGDTSLEVLFFVHGPTATGKSTFLEALRATLGDYSMTADFETFLKRQSVGGPRPDIARLAGARFVSSIEVDQGKELAEGLIKMLTGGDTVTARFLYGREFEFPPSFKLWLAANDAPKMNPDDGAIWRRIRRIPFERTVPKEKRNPSVKATLRDPMIAGPAILAWAVRGCLEYQRDGLGMCEAIEQATRDLREQMDPLKDFIDECCVLGPDLWADAGPLRHEYETWAGERGEKLVYNKKWGDGLRERGCVQMRKSRDGSPVRGWQGIGLASAEGQPPA